MKTHPQRRGTRAAVLLFTLVFASGCFNTQVAEFAGKVREHVEPMRPIYDHGAATYPGATESDKAVYREHQIQLERLLDAGEGKKSHEPAKPNADR